jgi:O-antigen/teichoic acid export membrane protein
MALMMGVSLYTSRVILVNLGIEDFGLFSVVGGLAVLFSFFNNALNGSTQRFLTVSIGKNDISEIKKVFSMSMNCHVIISFIILILAETIGLWLLNTQLNIPESKIYAANWVYQLTLLSCILSILNVPYTGTIVAYEKMSYFAWSSIISAVLKLVVAYLIVITDSERLIFYTVFLVAAAIIKFVVDRIYCRIRFSTCHYNFQWNGNLFKEMISFTGWNILKMGAVMGVSQGNNILINIYGGTVASAAMGIANQVNGNVYGFMQNVQTAFNPQITKTIACNEKEDYQSLIRMCAKVSSYILFFLVIPLILEMDIILKLWLKDVPLNTRILCIFSIVSVYLDSLIGPLSTAVMAHGAIQRYQIVTSVLWLISIPAAWLYLQSGMSFEYILISKIIAQIIILGYSLYFLKKNIVFEVASFIRNECFKTLIVLVSSLWISYLIISNFHYSVLGNLILSIVSSWAILIIIISAIGLTYRERIAVKNLLLKKAITWKKL